MFSFSTPELLQKQTKKLSWPTSHVGKSCQRLILKTVTEEYWVQLPQKYSPIVSILAGWSLFFFFPPNALLDK